MLLAAGADANLPSATTEDSLLHGVSRVTPLHLAVMRCRPQLVNDLIAQHGTNLDAQDSRGDTPLAYLVGDWAHRFAPHDLHRLVRLMTARGADITAVGRHHITMFELGIALVPDLEQEFAHVVTMRAIGPDGNTPLHVAGMVGSESLWSFLIRQGASVTATNNKGQRPLDMVTDARLQFVFKNIAGRRDVMISYSHKDTEVALLLRATLERHKITTWMDLMVR